MRYKHRRQWIEDRLLELADTFAINICAFKGTLLSQAFVAGKPLDSTQRQALQDKIHDWRLKLGYISWFVRWLNESIAR